MVVNAVPIRRPKIGKSGYPGYVQSSYKALLQLGINEKHSKNSFPRIESNGLSCLYMSISLFAAVNAACVRRPHDPGFRRPGSVWGRRVRSCYTPLHKGPRAGVHVAPHCHKNSSISATAASRDGTDRSGKGGRS